MADSQPWTIFVNVLEINREYSVDCQGNQTLASVVTKLVKENPELKQYAPAMNLRCTFRQSNSWLDHSQKVKVYTAIKAKIWTLEFYKKEINIQVGLNVQSIQVDLRKPIKSYVKELCNAYKIQASNEYTFALRLNSHDQKTLTALKKSQATMKSTKRAQKIISHLATSDSKIWLDEQKSFSDEENLLMFPEGVIKLERLVYYSDQAINKSRKTEAEVIYPQLKELMAQGHFSDLHDTVLHDLMKCAFVIDFGQDVATANPKSINQLDYLPKSKHLSKKQLLSNLDKYKGSSQLDLMYLFLNELRKSVDWGIDKFVLKSAKEHTSKFILLCISKNGVHKAHANSKSGEFYETVPFPKISTFKFQEQGIQFDYTNGKSELFVTEEGYKITTILSRYIDCEKESHNVSVIQAGKVDTTSVENMTSYFVVRTKPVIKASEAKAGPKFDHGTSQLMTRIRAKRFKAYASPYSNGEAFNASTSTFTTSDALGRVWNNNLMEVIRHLNQLGEGFKTESFCHEAQDEIMMHAEASGHRDQLMSSYNLMAEHLRQISHMLIDNEDPKKINEELNKFFHCANMSVFAACEYERLTNEQINDKLKEILNSMTYLSNTSGMTESNRLIIEKSFEQINAVRDILGKFYDSMGGQTSLNNLVMAMAADLALLQMELGGNAEFRADSELVMIGRNLENIKSKVKDNHAWIYNQDQCKNLLYDITTLRGIITSKMNKTDDPDLKNILNKLLIELDKIEPSIIAGNNFSMYAVTTEYYRKTEGQKDLNVIYNETQNLKSYLSNDIVLMTCMNMNPDRLSDLNNIVANMTNQLNEMQYSLTQGSEEAINHSVVDIVQFMAQSKEQISEYAKIRDALRVFKSLEDKITLLCSTVESTKITEVKENSIDIFYHISTDFHEAATSTKTALYDIDLMNSSGHRALIPELLDLYGQNFTYLSTELLLQSGIILDCMNDNSMNKLTIEEIVDSLSHEIALMNATTVRRDYDSCKLLGQVVQNHKESVDSKKDASQLRGYFFTRDPQELVAQELIVTSKSLIDSINPSMQYNTYNDSLQVSKVLYLMKKSMKHQKDDGKLYQMRDCHQELAEILMQGALSSPTRKFTEEEYKSVQNNLLKFADLLPIHTVTTEHIETKKNSLEKATVANVPVVTDKKSKQEYIEKLQESIQNSIGLVYNVFPTMDTLFIDSINLSDLLSESLEDIVTSAKALGLYTGDLKAAINEYNNAALNMFGNMSQKYCQDTLVESHLLLKEAAKVSKKHKLLCAALAKAGINVSDTDKIISKLLATQFVVRNGPGEESKGNLVVRYFNCEDRFDKSNSTIDSFSQSKNSTTDLQNFNDDFQKFANLLGSLAKILKEFESKSHLILALEQLDKDHFWNIIKSIGVDCSEKDITEISALLQKLNAITKNISYKSQEGYALHIKSRQKEIIELFDTIKNKLQSEDPDKFVIEQHKLLLNNLVSNQLKNLKKPPCVPKSDLNATNFNKIDQKYCQILTNAISIVEMKRAIENKNGGISKENLTKESAELKTKIDELKDFLRDINPLTVVSRSLMDFCSATFEAQLIGARQLKADIEMENVSDAGKEKIVHDIENIVKSVIQQHSLMTSTLSGKKPSEIVVKNLVSAIENLEWLMMSLNTATESLMEFQTKKEFEHFATKVTNALKKLVEVGREMRDNVVHVDIDSHDYSSCVTKIKASSDKFLKLLEECKNMMNKFHGLDNAYRAIFEGYNSLLSGESKQYDPINNNALKSMMNDDLEALDDLLRNFEKDLDDPKALKRDAKHIADLYNQNLKRNYHQAASNGVNKLLLDDLLADLGDIGKLLAGAIGAKADNKPDSDKTVKEAINMIRAKADHTKELAGKLSPISNSLERYEKDIKSIHNSIDKTSGKSIKDMSSKPAMTLKEGKEIGKTLIDEIDKLNDEFMKLLDVLKESETAKANEDQCAKKVDKFLEDLTAMNSKDLKPTIDFFVSSLLANQSNDPSDIPDIINNSPLSSFLSEQETIANRLRQSLGSDNSIETISQCAIDLKKSADELKKYIQNIEEEAYSLKSFLDSIQKKFEALKETIEGEKVQKVHSSLNKLEEVEEMCYVALDSLLSNALETDAKSSDVSKVIDSFSLLYASVEDFTKNYSGNASKSTDAIKETTKADLIEAIDGMINHICDCKTMEDKPISKKSFMEQNALNQEKIKNIVDLLTNRVLDKEEEERKAREKIEASNKKLNEMLDRLKNTAKVDWDAVDEEKKELIELIVETIKDFGELLDLNATVMANFSGCQSAAGVRNQVIQSTLNNILTNSLDVYLESAQYFIKGLPESQPMLLNSTLNTIAGVVYKKKYNKFMKLQSPETYEEEQQLINKIFENSTKIESILKTKKFKTEEGQTSFKNILDKFRIQININESGKDLHDATKKH